VGPGDAATGFAQQLAISVLTRLLDVPPEMAPRFIEWTVRLLRVGPLDQAARATVVSEMIGYFDDLLQERAAAAAVRDGNLARAGGPPHVGSGPDAVAAARPVRRDLIAGSYRGRLEDEWSGQ